MRRSQTCSLSAVLARQQQLGVHPILDHVGRTPLAGDHGVVTQVPEEIVGQILRPAVLLPPALHLEGLMVEGEDAAGAVPIGGPEGIQVDPIGPAVHRVRRGIAGLLHHFVALDHLHQGGLPWIGLGIEDMNPRRVGPRHDEVSPLDMGVGRPGTQVRAAGIPAEVVQLVAALRELGAPHQSTERGAIGIGIHDADGVALAVLAAAEQGHVRQPFARGLHGQLGGGVEGWVGTQACHGCRSWFGCIVVLTRYLRRNDIPADMPHGGVVRSSSGAALRCVPWLPPPCAPPVPPRRCSPALSMLERAGAWFGPAPPAGRSQSRSGRRAEGSRWLAGPVLARAGPSRA